ncbi:unnamed protein product [Linum trigynum]|uniref:Uncharacterized protein n=1 Tax=Linum trigynum TaxID=586398 RepID=A0AAV2GT13_9ROSI
MGKEQPVEALTLSGLLDLETLKTLPIKVWDSLEKRMFDVRHLCHGGSLLATLRLLLNLVFLGLRVPMVLFLLNKPRLCLPPIPPSVVSRMNLCQLCLAY